MRFEKSSVASTKEACLLVFAKAPEPGAAKTRLIPLLGAEGAARLQANLTRRALATAMAADIGPVALWCAPDTGHPCFAALGAELGIVLHSQCGGDLGDKMLYAATLSLTQHRYALLLGTDCPLLTAEHLRLVLAELRQGKDAVLIPAQDGGYVLLGLARASSELFRGVAWGSDKVLRQTRERLDRLAFRCSELETLPDLDRPEDGEKLRWEHPHLWRDLIAEENTP